MLLQTRLASGVPAGYRRFSGMDMNILASKYRTTLTDYAPSHWKTNQVVTVDTHVNVPDPRHHTTRFHRAHLHDALLQHVPGDSIHLGKRVARAVATDDKVSLYFEDGSEAHGDLLIGADGIKSVRIQLQSFADP
jgi:2-polyprenyl-6-methoxyphenol hydroxylase-like FAD-dependent oxidoreductase